MEIQILVSPSVPSFLTVFLLVYLSGIFVLFRNWVPKQRSEASSCLLSLTHGTPSVYLALYAVLKTPAPSLGTPNTAIQNTVLEFSIAYFSLDLLHYIIFNPHEILFILHHLATLYVFMSCRYLVHHGAHEVLVLLILAEMTSACQNIWTVAGFRKADVPLAARIHEFLSPCFFAFYSLARGIMGPLFVCKLGIFYLSGAAEGLPRWARVYWMVVIVSSTLVSILWVSLQWRHWYNEREKKDS